MTNLSDAALIAAEQPTRVPPEKSRGGDWVQLGDELYRIPPLAFRDLQDLADEIESLKDIDGRPSQAQMRTVVKIVLAALKRNYPSATMEQVDDMLDIGNYGVVLNAVLSIGGLRKVGGPPGEVVASTGPGSTSA